MAQIELSSLYDLVWSGTALTISSRTSNMSPVWNFQTRFRSWGASRRLEPRILHFTGAAKPWLGDVTPWHDAAARLAEDAAALLPLSLPLRLLTPEEVDAHNSEYGTLKEKLRSVIDLRRRLRARAILRLHREAAI